MEFVIDNVEYSNTENENEQEIQNLLVENLRSQYSEIQNIVIDVEQNVNTHSDLDSDLENLTTTRLNTYICGLCNTKLSSSKEHTRHLKTIKHRNNKNNCKMLIMPYISNLIPRDDEWQKLKRKYFINKNYDNDDLYLLKICQQHKNKSLNLDDENDKKEYFNWKVNMIIRDIENIQENKYNENIQENKKYNENIQENKILNNNCEDNFNLDEINFILNNVNLDEIKNILTLRTICLCKNFKCELCSEKNVNLIFKQVKLFERNLNSLLDNYEHNNLNEEIFTIKNIIEKANINASILAEALYILFKNSLSYNILEVKNKLRVNYHVNNFRDDELKFIWIYKNQNREFFIEDEGELIKKIEIILEHLCSKIGLNEEYDCYNFMKRCPNFILKKIFDILKGLFLLNNLI